MSTIIGIYNDLDTAQKVVSDLEQRGDIGKSDMHLATYDKRAQERSSGGFFDSLSHLFDTQPREIGNSQDAMVQQLTTWGVTQSEAQSYVSAMRNGGTLVLVNSPSDRTDQVKQIMDSYNPSDLDEQGAGWQSQGAQDFGQGANFQGTQNFDQTRDYRDTENTQVSQDFQRSKDYQNADETHIPTVEEQMRVGKREVQRGGVRVYTTTTEQPYEETHTVRDESVNVERRPADRPATEADLQNAFKDQDFEVTETDEELITDKQARVTGEVVVSKDVNERPETVRDTLRRTEVHTEDLGAGTGKRSFRDYQQFEPDFQSHYQQNFANRGYQYDRYAPAYEYGYNLAGSDRYQGQQWNTIEPQVRMDWERQHPQSSWDDVKDAVKYSWQRAQGNF